ncbi:histidinol-phosphate transaminase [Neolewinella antarctica]|uniref:Histidinol-phosphate aminotransferase n=1 Tax=Neolewinella antarctica TaxID=442734 RepID=A0ABX0XDB9_9BACT|nr:histidinol-phosphate transaminase [Neolewinella antarctica]NJC27080.1 histidinol-phosphate aminotransferase [Neolewinella antarctica]
MTNTLINWTPAKITALVRPNLLQLKPYSSARAEFKGPAEVLLDANESPWETGRNRYPDPQSTELRKAFGKLRGFNPDQIVWGNGSDELVDQITRIFCNAGDAVHALPPTFGMYKVAAGIADAEFRATTLTENFTIPVEELKASWDKKSKVLWLCSPNNPSGNAIDGEVLEDLIRSFPGIVVLDEAYIDFVPELSFVSRLEKFPNLIITQTLSKGWGMAGIRCGAAFASPFIIRMLNTIKMPYNINVLTTGVALEMLSKPAEMEQKVATMISERKRLERGLWEMDLVEHVFPSVTNFMLVRFKDSAKVYQHLLDKAIVVRNQAYQPNAENCLRITAGLSEENDRLLAALREL